MRPDLAKALKAPRSSFVIAAARAVPIEDTLMLEKTTGDEVTIVPAKIIKLKPLRQVKNERR